jgi:hypothetical protein
MGARRIGPDLDGDPVAQASFMRCGPCHDLKSVGVDLVDRDGNTICHGHLHVEEAEEFHRLWGEAIEMVRAARKPN